MGVRGRREWDYNFERKKTCFYSKYVLTIKGNWGFFRTGAKFVQATFDL
jgi:hypothetical protein